MANICDELKSSLRLTIESNQSLHIYKSIYSHKFITTTRRHSFGLKCITLVSQECCVWYATKLKIYIDDMEMDVNRIVCGMCVFLAELKLVMISLGMTRAISIKSASMMTTTATTTTTMFEWK